MREWLDHRILRGHRMDNYPDPAVDRRGYNRSLYDLRTEAKYHLAGYEATRNVRERCLFMTFGKIQFWYDTFPRVLISTLLSNRAAYGILPSYDTMLKLEHFVASRYLPFTQRGQPPDTLLFLPAPPMDQTVNGNRFLWYSSPLHKLVEEFQRIIERDEPLVIEGLALKLYGGWARRSLLSEQDVVNRSLVASYDACATDYARLAGDPEALKLFAQEVQHYYYTHDRQHKSFIELLVLYSQSKEVLPFYVRFFSGWEILGFEFWHHPTFWLVIDFFLVGFSIFFLNLALVGILYFFCLV